MRLTLLSPAEVTVTSWMHILYPYLIEMNLNSYHQYHTVGTCDIFVLYEMMCELGHQVQFTILNNPSAAQTSHFMLYATVQ